MCQNELSMRHLRIIFMSLGYHPIDNSIVMLHNAGYDESKFGAHSLRSGFVTECGRQGKNLGDVMAMTTHRNVATCLRYYQSGNIINNSALNLAD